MHAYSNLRKENFPKTQRPLPKKPPSSRLIAVYFQPEPEVVSDSLPFHLFRKHADRHYPALYFHPQNKKMDEGFLKQYDIQAVPLSDACFVSKISYSLFITSPQFYEILNRAHPEAEFYLIFQSDSFLIQRGLENFMNHPFDYYGAVWEKGNIPGAWCEPRHPEQEVLDPSLYSKMKSIRVGNGGFSLRRIEPCRRVCSSHRLDQLSYMQEDAFYCNFGQLTGLRFATEDLARRFSWEDAPAIKTYIQDLGISRPIGFHNLPVEMAELLIQSALL